jgi:hypothetical protein
LQLIRERILTMTVVAAQLAVVAVKCELRVSRVIETRVVPSNRAVAVLAFLAAPAIMRIVFRVTVKTCRLCLLERLVFVASKALRVPV